MTNICMPPLSGRYLFMTAVFLAVFAGVLLPVSIGADPDQQLSDKTAIAPGAHQDRKWKGILDSAKGGSLKLDVFPKGGKFKPESAAATAGGPEKWLVTENTASAAKFLGTVPPNTPKQSYPPSFSGLFQPGGGGAGKGNPPPEPEERPWSIASGFDVGDHVYEASGAVENGKPNGAHAIVPTFESVKEYDVDCPVAGENGEIVRMETLIQKATAALVAKYGGDGEEQGRFVPGEINVIRDGKGSINTKQGLQDPDHGDANMARIEINRTLNNDAKYFIAMPKWLQLSDEDPTKRPAHEAQVFWTTKFHEPLGEHEELHKEKYETCVKKSQAAVDVFAKTVYFGEACYGQEQKAAAAARARLLADGQYQEGKQAVLAEITALLRDLTEEQAKYDDVTDHGREQHKIGGKDVEYDGDRPLR